MHRFLSSNRHAKHIQHYVLNCSIGDWFVLYQMNKQMNKRFFSEFLALVSIKVNPDPYLRADPEVDIMKTEDDTQANGTAFYDEEELGKWSLVKGQNKTKCLTSAKREEKLTNDFVMNLYFQNVYT